MPSTGRDDVSPKREIGSVHAKSAGTSAVLEESRRCRASTSTAEPSGASIGHAKLVTENSIHISGHKRKDDLSAQAMLQLVHENAWMHVIDAAPTMDNVLGMPAKVWLEILPQQDQAELAVHFQNEIHATALLARSVSMHGPESAQTERSSKRLHDARYRKDTCLQQCMRRAEAILASGTSA